MIAVELAVLTSQREELSMLEQAGSERMCGGVVAGEKVVS